MSEPAYQIAAAFGKRGGPWCQAILSGHRLVEECKSCGAVIHYASGPMVGRLDPKKGSSWPDALGCGAFPYFIVSGRLLAILTRFLSVPHPVHRFHLDDRVPAKLMDIPSPDYFWIDGQKLRFARLDFHASGFVGVWFCAACGTRHHEIGETLKRQRSGEFIHTIDGASWTGAPLFTTDLSHCVFFGSPAVKAAIAATSVSNVEFTEACISDARRAAHGRTG